MVDRTRGTEHAMRTLIIASGVLVGSLVLAPASVFAQPGKPPAVRPVKPAVPAFPGEGALLHDPDTKLVGACNYEGKSCAGVDPVTGAVRPLTTAPKAA